MHEFAQDNEIERIVFEETFGRGDAKYRLDSLQHAATLFATLYGIRFMRLSPNQWKAAILGNGRLSKAEYLKLSQEKWPELKLETDDEAAARCLLEYALQGDLL